MKSQALQDLVSKIFSDEKTKQQFISNPNSILSQFSLTEREKKAVLKAHAKLGTGTYDSKQFEKAIHTNEMWI